jgi:hypothetical protein
MYSFAGMDLQLLNGIVTSFWRILLNWHEITKILLTLRKITKKIIKNFQLPKKSGKLQNITKSN